ncbi:hypothetical protein JCM5353_006063 [Sporobolomyces roseus]
MESVHKIVDSTKDLLASYTSSQPSADQSQPQQQQSSTSVPVTDDLLGVTSGQTAPPSDLGAATFSGDVEHQSVTESNSSDGYIPYSATGRDSTGTFSGGANEDVPDLPNAGEVPEKK